MERMRLEMEARDRIKAEEQERQRAGEEERCRVLRAKVRGERRSCPCNVAWRARVV